MALELDHYCPSCEGTRTFSRTASMYLHLGLKVKWACPDCSHVVVTVDGEVDTGPDAPG